IHPGAHVFTASADGVADESWKVEVANGGTYEHTFGFGDGGPAHDDALPDQRHAAKRPIPTSVYVMGGISAAFAVPPVVLMVRAKSVKDDYDASNGTRDAATLENQRNEVKSANLLADVFLGATISALVTTGILYVTRPVRRAAVTGRTKLRGESSWMLLP